MSLLNSQTTPSNLFNEDKPLLEVYNLAKQFAHQKSPIFSNLSFKVQAGKIVALVGKSGIGKSTLLNCVSGIETSSQGIVTTQGSIGYLPQSNFFLPWRTVLQNILLPVEVNSGITPEHIGRALKLLEEFDLTCFKDKYFHQISGGTKQKVGLVRTLLTGPSVLLLDEPFSAIDFVVRLNLGRNLRKYIQKSQTGAVLVTHSIEEAIMLSDYIIVLGDKPARIVYESSICLSNDERDPVLIHKTHSFTTVFAAVWKCMNN